MDRDGHLDLIWQREGSGEVRIWHMQGTAQIESVAISQGVGASGWRISGVADMDGDGWNDLVWRDYTTGGLSTWQMADAQVLETSWLEPETIADLSWASWAYAT